MTYRYKLTEACAQCGTEPPYNLFNIPVRNVDGVPQIKIEGEWIDCPKDTARIVACVNACEGIADPSAIKDVVEAAQALIANRDENCGDLEVYKTGTPHGDFWSPSASMVHSRAVAPLRAALAKLDGGAA